MNVLHVAGTFPPAYAYGGPPRSVDNLTSAIVDRGHDVTVFTTDAKDSENRIEDYENPEVRNGVDVYRFRNLSNNLAWKNIQFPPKMLSAILSSIGQYDVLHTHEFRSPPTAFAHIAARRKGVPHVHQPRGSVPRYELSRLKQGFDFLFGNQFISTVDGIIASSTTESSNYPDVFPEIDLEKVHHVPNGISAETYRDIPEPGKFRAEYDIPQEEDIMLFLSRLHPRKGGDLLIDAVSEFLEENVCLAFVGPDEGAFETWKARAEAKGISDRTLFTGPLYDSEKLAAYVDADVFVLPSKNEYESFGNVVIEAMVCGTPVVTTDVCGVSEWLDHESCSSVAPTAAALRDGIEEVLSSTHDRDSIREYAWENFTWDAVADQTVSVYEEVIR